VETESRQPIHLAQAWREARELVWARRGRFAVGLLLMLVSRVAGLVLPASAKVVIDRVIGQGRLDLLVPLAVGVGAATVIQAASPFGLSLLLGITAQHTITDLRRAVQAHVGRLPTRYFDSTHSGVLISRIMSDAEGIRNLVGAGLVQLAGSVMTAALALGLLFWVDWRLTLIILVVLAVFGFVVRYAFSRLRPIYRDRGRINAEVTARLTEALGGIRVVKLYTAERREELEFTRGVHRLLRNVASSLVGSSAMTAFSALVFGGVSVVMMVVGVNAIVAGTMTLGDLIMYVFFTGLLVTPMIQIAAIGTQISEAFAGLDRIRDLLAQRTEDEADGTREPLAGITGDLAFERVIFGYEPAVPVLRKVSFVSPAGSTTALVGSSGSGKSTLISLVCAFNHPQSGRVLIDGRDLAGIRLRDYRSRLGVVLQESFLFGGTIADNIAYGRPHASRSEVEWAGRIAHCDEFVDPLEQGYATVVGERGVRLSGGQRQRVAIARAILADPTILILDEATSSLDSESEQLIQDALRRLRRGRTTFVIAHRLSTIQSADQILVLEKGEIVERGTHRELLARGGRYRDLYDRQYRLESERFVNPGEELVAVDEAL
jgi:ATP-binding cassette, subfamily B, putative efflux pump